MFCKARTLTFSATLVLLTLLAFGQSGPRTTAQSVRGHFASVNRRILTMAKDFPDDKYDFKLKPEMRTFGAVIVHIASGNVYASKAGRGENVKWDELDPKDYPNKTAVVALMEKSIADAEATLSRRQYLAGIEDILRVERLLHRAHGVDRLEPKLGLEVFLLALPDTVLAGAGTVHGQRPFDQALRQALCARDLVGVVHVHQ